MARINRKAFTLVEMLVVIVIISMLVALLVPAVISARERARRLSCMNRMNQLGKGITQYELAKKQLPGYVNQFGGSKLGALSARGGGSLSWVVMVLENIGRADLWEKWTDDSATPAERIVALSETVCASDTERRGVKGALSFAANCGISDFRLDGGTDDAATYRAHPGWPSGYDPYANNDLGLFFCNDPSVSGKPPVTIALDEIKDGSQTTIMLSENRNATFWAAPSWPTGSPRQADVGIVWWSATPSWTGVPGQVAINTEESPSNPRYSAHPSSFHPGGVNVVYADGHADFISDRVDYTVYLDQMIPDQDEARKFGLVP